MKRISVGLALLGWSLSCGCGGAPDAHVDAAIAAEPEQETSLEAAPEATAAAEADPLEQILPKGTFTSVDAFCAAQKALIAPRLVTAAAELAEFGDHETLSPSCEDDAAALREAHVAIGAPLYDVRAVTVEAGFATDTFLLVRSDDGWSAVREAFLSAVHDDPGCPSIVRESALVEVRIERGALVVVTTADRALMSGDVPGDLVMTRARACSLDDGAMSCSEPVVVRASTSEYRDGYEAARTESEIFATYYAVDASGKTIVATENFGESF